MGISRKILMSLFFLSALPASSFADDQPLRPIPREQVAIEVSGSVAVGSQIRLDLRSYWNSVDEATGNEILSFWIALPDRGEPMLIVTGQPASGDLHSCVTIGKPAILQGVRIAQITIRPILSSGEEWVKVLDLNLQISTSGIGVNEVVRSGHSRSFDSIINSLVINPPSNNGVDEFDQEHMLIICPDFAEDVMTPFVEWKRRKGLEVTLSTLSDIGITTSDYAGLKAYLQEAYDTWPNRPDFVLLAGDESVLPVRWDYTDDPPTQFSSASVPGNYVDENYFACLEGDDFFPDVILGRWSIPVFEGQYPYIYMSSKVMRYEMDPNLYNTDWYRHAAVTAQGPEYDPTNLTQRETKLHTRDILLNFGFDEVDTLFAVATPELLVQWIDDGRSYLNHRGAGWDVGWAGNNFYIDHVLQLQNSFMLPVVTAIGCGVGLFGEPDPCFGDFWMWIVGTITNHRGAISFIGPGWNTHTLFNDSLDIGIYQSQFESNEPRIATALIAGKMFMYEAFDEYIAGDPDIEEILRVAFNEYYVLADPELMPYSDIPALMETTIPGALSIGSFPLNFTVNDGYGQPVEGAQVCLYHPTEFQDADLTGVDGTVTLDWNASTESSFVYFTVTNHNCKAIVDSIAVIGSNPYILHYDYILDDSIGGNGDGGLSPGETVVWTEFLRNWGLTDAFGVTASLSTSESTITILEGYSTFGDIPAESIAVGTPDFEIELDAEQYEIGSPLDFQIEVNDALDSTWTSSFSIPLITPMFTIVYAVPNVYSTQQFYRGDTTMIHIGMYNTGSEDIIGGTIELVTDDPYIEILEGSIAIDTFAVGELYLSIDEGDSFMVASPVTTPIGHTCEFFIRITSDQATYAYRDSSQFSLDLQGFLPCDPGFDPLGTYYAYESYDSLYPECPSYEWLEIDPIAGGPGEVLPFSSEIQTLTVDLPFTFSYWGEDFTRLSVSADGWIMPGETATVLPLNWQLPDSDEVSGMIAALWDDLWNTTEETGRISTYYESATGKFYIEYYQVTHGATSMPQETFQIVLCDPNIYPTVSGDAEILFYYKSLHLFGLVSSTVGIESIDQASALNYSYLNGPDPSAHGLQDSLAILWTPDPPWEVVVPLQPEQEEIFQIPASFSFDQPYPNPFNPAAVLSFAIPITGKVELDIFDLQGRKVAQVYQGNLNAGWHRFEFDGSELGSGMYFARLYYMNQATVHKLILIK